MPTLQIALFPKSNSIAFHPAIPSGLNVLGQASYEQTIQPWQARLPYRQKVNFTDQITIQVSGGFTFHITNALPTLFICDKFQNVISGINLNVAPYFKGTQQVSGNNYVNPISGAIYPLVTSMWSFNFANFPSQVPSGGVFYLKMIVQNYGDTNTATYFSEPIFLSDTLPNTKLIQFNYTTNNAAKNIIVSNWWNDYPTNTAPYLPVFSIRVEGYLNMFSPKVINIGYLQQLYQQNQIKTQQVRTWKLKIGEISLGIPYYILEMMTEALLADMFIIDGYSYILYNPQGSPSLTDLWKIKDSDISPLVYGECAIMERWLSQQAIVTPSPHPFAGIFSSEFDNTFD